MNVLPAILPLRSQCTECGSQSEIRYQITKGGRRQFRYQCLRCGRLLGEWLGFNRLPIAEFVVIDRALEAKGYQDRSRNWQTSYAERREQENQAWWEQFSEYLNSANWHRKRALVIKRSGGFCEALLECEGGKAFEVHHTSYKHVGNEPLWELRAVCGRCHAAITALDRQQRTGTTG